MLSTCKYRKRKCNVYTNNVYFLHSINRARKLLSIRLFDGLQASPTTDDAGDKRSTAAASPPAPPPRWKRSVKDCDYSLLCVSQFTLCCQLKGNKPDYHLAMPPQEAQMLYEQLLGRLRSAYRTERVFSGQFGAYMQLSIVNDGPVTIEVDSLRGAVASQEVCVPLAALETLN